MDTEYICSKCDFKTLMKCNYDAHLKTEFHKTGKRKTRTDKKVPDKCPHCEYITTVSTSMQTHILRHMPEDEQKTKSKFYCDDCKIGFLHKSQYDYHIISLKHKERAEYIDK